MRDAQHWWSPEPSNSISSSACRESRNATQDEGWTAGLGVSRLHEVIGPNMSAGSERASRPRSSCSLSVCRLSSGIRAIVPAKMRDAFTIGATPSEKTSAVMALDP